MSIIEKLGITPGPWTDDLCTFGPNGKPIMVCTKNGYRNGTGTLEGRMNARLIAAAPEMLEALIELYDDWKYIEYTDPDLVIKPIIEKATGRTWEEIKELSNGTKN